MSLPSLATLFGLTVCVMATAVVLLFLQYLLGHARTKALTMFGAWMLYAGILGYTGVVASKMPPGPVFLLAPVMFILATFVMRNAEVGTFARRVPAAWLIGLQAFRIVVEIVLYGLYQNGLIPRMLTFEGANFDILIGLTAPIIAWLVNRRRIRRSIVRAWNVVGLLLLANVVLRSMLIFGGVLRSGSATLALTQFPYTFLPGFLVPLAIYLHVLTLRATAASIPEHEKRGAVLLTNTPTEARVATD